MKRVILLLAVGCWLLANTNATAQGVKFGARAGLNLSKMAMNSGDEDNEAPELDNLVGFHVGVVADIKLHDLLYFQPGLMFSTKGAKKSESMMGLADYEISFNPSYLELPLMLSFKYSFTNDFAVRVNAGPYAAFGLFGKYKMKTTAMGQTNEDSIDLFTKEEGEDEAMFKRFDAGLGFGGGVEFKQFYLGVNYDLGLTNIGNNGDNSDATAKNRTIGISLGYNF